MTQLIFAGDIQGCGDEFDELLSRARRKFGREFELWLVGDLVNRGPYSLRVLERVRELEESGRARVVLGNHDLALLAIWQGLRDLRPQDTYGEVLDDRGADDMMHWLRRRPLVERGVIDDQPFAMVHASVHPDWALDELEARAKRVQARLAAPDLSELRELLGGEAAAGDGELAADRDLLSRLTRCRGIARGGEWTSEEPPDRRDAWYERWRLGRHPYGVVYGHWAMQGLHVAPGLRGLDTGCVHHGRGRDGYLTAWLPGLKTTKRRRRGLAPFDTPDERLWQIPARRRYYGED
ncbi:MAG: symmetrical bis(5'-nucleosyl)-tetraphosphatase [Deltaproteobacteria bacterium]|nr:symmetrical bis(5'-nucleosyl)-tetraphosphatase [Deltaproteobacteria bacterium]MBW2418296.1 symmetrical bis(5'-nucleosyl)-tetraphosphatase [Deltaproteobacteria bacterium]